MIYELSHRTTYEYDHSVDLANHVLRLTPREFSSQAVAQANLVTVPAVSRLTSATDHFGNGVTYLSIEEPHERFEVETQCIIEVTARPVIDVEASPPWESVREALIGDGFPAEPDVAEFAFPTPQTPLLPAVRDYAAKSFLAGRPILAAARDLTRRIHDDFVFDSTATLVSTPLAEVMAKRRGVCQDFAQVMLAGLRSHGLAGRYISGYIQTFGADGKPRLVGGDASHAWVSVWSPAHGWVEFDPTNDLMVSDQHVVLGWGRDYSDVSPILGIILGGGEHRLDVSVRLVPVDLATGRSAGHPTDRGAAGPSGR